MKKLSSQEIRDKIKEHGWKQGALLCDRLARRILSNDVPEGSVAVIVTQHCDLLHPDFENEPFAEILLCRKVAVEDKNLMTGKSPRRLQLRFLDEKKQSFVFEVNIASKQMLDRRLLLEYSVSGCLTIDQYSLRFLREFMAKRYSRYARPDGFDSLISGKAEKKKLQKILKSLNEYTKRLFIAISPDGELKRGEKYSVEIVLLLDSATMDDGSERTVNKKIVELDELFEGLVESVEIEPKYDTEFSYADSEYYRVWDFDHYSASDFEDLKGEFAYQPFEDSASSSLLGRFWQSLSRFIGR